MPYTAPDGAVYATDAEVEAFLEEAAALPFDLDVACEQFLELHGDGAEETARRAAANARDVGNPEWADTYEKIADEFARRTAACAANPRPPSKLTEEDEAALRKHLAAFPWPRVE